MKELFCFIALCSLIACSSEKDLTEAAIRRYIDIKSHQVNAPVTIDEISDLRVSRVGETALDLARIDANSDWYRAARDVGDSASMQMVKKSIDSLQTQIDDRTDNSKLYRRADLFIKFRTEEQFFEQTAFFFLDKNYNVVEIEPTLNKNPVR